MIAGIELLRRSEGYIPPETLQQIQSAADALRMRDFNANRGIVGVTAKGGPMQPLQTSAGDMGVPYYATVEEQRQAALKALTEHSMQKPGQQTKTKAGSASPVASVAKVAAAAAVTYFTGGTGAAVGAGILSAGNEASQY